MRKIIFLDRDGVINKEIGDYVITWDEFEINEGLIETLQLFQKHGFEFVIITNQGCIDKGMCSIQDVEKIMDDLIALLKMNGIVVLDYYYSPHHSDFNNSLDKKPDSIMLEKAIARFNVDVSASYMIGDHERDILAGQKVGLKSIKIDSNQNLLDIAPQIIKIE